MKARSLWLALTLALLTTMVAACGSDDDDTAGGTGGPETTAQDEAPDGGGATGTIRIGTYLEGTNLDPASTTQGQPIIQYLLPVYDTLIRRTADFEFEPMLATSWEYTDAEKLTFEMKLRDDVDFSDGTHFDAEAVKANLERSKAGTGAGARQMQTMESVEAADPTTVVIHLSQPNPTLELALSFLPGMMVSPAAFDNPDLDTHPVGSGPFTFDADSFVAGSQWAYDVRPDYWDPSLQTLERLELTLIIDPEARFNALRDGQVDIALGTTAQIPDAEAAGLDVTMFFVDWQGLILMDRNGEVQPALADKRVRQALNHAVDREAIVEGVLSGYGAPATSIFPESSPAYVAEMEERYPYDPEKARELLAEAGYPDGFELHTPSSANLNTFAEALAGMLSEVGVTLNITTLETGFIDAVISGDYESPVMSFGMEHPATDGNLLFVPEAVFNPFGVDLPEVVDLMTEAATLPADEAAESYQEVNEILTEEAWFLVTHRLESVYFTNPAVGNFETYQNQAAPAPYGWTIDD